MPTLLNSPTLYSVVWFEVFARSDLTYDVSLKLFLVIRLSISSSEESKLTKGLLGFHTSIIVVLTVFGSFLPAKWPSGARGGMETSVRGVLSEKMYC